MNETILELRELNKSYKKAKVLKNINLKVEREKIYGLLGPNGAGKSTILKIITGIVSTTSGEIFYNGKKMNPKDFKDIGALIESPALYKNLTAYENLKIHAELYGISDDRIEEVIETMGIKNDNKRVGKYSLGMKQRLGIAIAILHKPKILILDEPTNGLDPFGILELRALIREFTKNGMTVIISSHILAEIENVADHIGIISDGELKFEEDIKNISNLEEKFIEVLK